jgi:hypothetical protein
MFACWVFRRLTLAFTLALTALCLLLPSQALAQVEITSAGPITKVGITPTGNLYAYHQLFSSQLYYSGESDSAAVWAVHDVDSGLLYGPASVGAGVNMTSPAGYTYWTSVTQTGPTGTGIAADPFKIISTMTGGTLTAVITVTYVIGQEAFNTSLQVTDNSGVDRNLRIFLGADLYYGSLDAGYPLHDPATGSVGGEVPSGTHAGFTGWFIPMTPADRYFAGSYSAMWGEIGSRQLSNTNTCPTAGSSCDYGAALQWNVALPANGSTTIIDVDQLFSGELKLLPLSLHNGTVGTPYSQLFTPLGGGSVPPYTVTWLSGSVPPGLTFDPATRTLSGTPTTAGTYSFTLRVTDSTPATPKEGDFPYVLIVLGNNNAVSHPIPALGAGALVVLMLALGIAASGVARRKT